MSEYIVTAWETIRSLRSYKITADSYEHAEELWQKIDIRQYTGILEEECIDGDIDEIVEVLKNSQGS